MVVGALPPEGALPVAARLDAVVVGAVRMDVDVVGSDPEVIPARDFLTAVAGRAPVVVVPPLVFPVALGYE
jgi:hypothetical protein